MIASTKTREARARRQLNRQGYTLHKSRVITTTHDNQGGYMIVQSRNNAIEAGEQFNLALEDVERFIAE